MFEVLVPLACDVLHGQSVGVLQVQQGLQGWRVNQRVVHIRKGAQGVIFLYRCIFLHFLFATNITRTVSILTTVSVDGKCCVLHYLRKWTLTLMSILGQTQVPRTSTSTSTHLLSSVELEGKCCDLHYVTKKYGHQLRI